MGMTSGQLVVVRSAYTGLRFIVSNLRAAIDQAVFEVKAQYEDTAPLVSMTVTASVGDDGVISDPGSSTTSADVTICLNGHSGALDALEYGTEYVCGLAVYDEDGRRYEPLETRRSFRVIPGSVVDV